MPYTPLNADQATLEVVGRTLRVKDASLDAGKVAPAATQYIDSSGFTIQHNNKPVVLIVLGGGFLQTYTAAIADGLVDGQELTLVLVDEHFADSIKILDGTNTLLRGDWVRGAPETWLRLVWRSSYSKWIEIGRDRGQGTETGLGAFAVGAGTASGDYAHAEGKNTYASGDYAHVEGESTTASGNYSHAEGFLTTASGLGSHAQGLLTTAIGDKSHAMGFLAVASLQGQFAQAAAQRATAGDAQFTRYTMRGTTIDAAAIELTAPARFTLNDDKVYACRINIAAMKADLSQSAWFNRMVLVSRGEGANDVTKVAEYTIQDIGSNSGAPPAGWAVTFTADDVNDSLKIEVTGAAATTVYWVAVIECVEVA